MSNSLTNQCNEKFLSALSNYLNNNADAINKNEIINLQKTCNISEKDAFQILLAEHCGFNFENSVLDKLIYKLYLPNSVCKLKRAEYTDNAYYKNIKISEVSYNNWELGFKSYKPFEAFVCDDFKTGSDGELFPQIGYFSKQFKYPCVCENGREWMLITPNEINTMKESIKNAKGNVLTFGLGLGYFQYMTSLKSEVNTITIVERDKSVIQLFEKFILPQFKYADKIKIIESDAFYYADTQMINLPYNYVFVDIWRDVSDGLDLYLKFKKYEKLMPKAEINYWIEKSILCYI